VPGSYSKAQGTVPPVANGTGSKSAAIDLIKIEKIEGTGSAGTGTNKPGGEGLAQCVPLRTVPARTFAARADLHLLIASSKNHHRQVALQIQGNN